uniref:Roc domain-containing protein n=1 Tax=Macrostomum lignano TaxID=282301 RepID=A0A1I8FQ65_9PLAT
VLPTPETSRKLYHLSTLKSIDLSYNSIDQFPSQRTGPPLCSEKIDLSHNRIDSVNLNGGDRHWPVGVRWPPFDLSHNPNLTSLPDEIGNLSKLWEHATRRLKLSLDASLIRVEPRTSSCWSGFGGRGKTSLLRALHEAENSRETVAAPTVGIAVTPWSPAFTVEGCDARLRRLKPCGWCEHQKPQAPACPVICVGTHADTLRPEPRHDHSRILFEQESRHTDSSTRLRRRLSNYVGGRRAITCDGPDGAWSYVKAETLVMEEGAPIPARLNCQDLPSALLPVGYQLRKMRPTARGMAVPSCMAQIADCSRKFNGFIRVGPWASLCGSQIRSAVHWQTDHEEDRTSLFPVHAQIPQYLRIWSKFRKSVLRALDPRNLLLVVIDREPFITLPLPSILKMGQDGVMFACLASLRATWNRRRPPQLPLTYEAFFLRANLRGEAHPRRGGRRGLQLQALRWFGICGVPLCPNGAYLLAQIADIIDVVIEECGTPA